MYPSGSMMTPDPMLSCLPSTRLVVRRLPSTGPYPVTCSWTTLGVTRFTSALTELLNWCSESESFLLASARAVWAAMLGTNASQARQHHAMPIATALNVRLLLLDVCAPDKPLCIPSPANDDKILNLILFGTLLLQGCLLTTTQAEKLKTALSCLRSLPNIRARETVDLGNLISDVPLLIPDR